MALPEAIQHGEFEQARRLLSDPGYDVNEIDSAGKTALLWSIELVKHKQDNYADITKRLLEHPLMKINWVCKPNKYDSSDHCHWEIHGACALHWACRITATSSCGVQLLLADPRCNVNRKNFHGQRTALFFVAQYAKHENDVHAEIMRLLLQHPDCDINARSKHKCTALHDACKYYVASSIGAKLLLSDPRSDVSIQNNRGETALMLALESSKNKDDVIKLFLERDNININVRNKDGESALHYSAMRCKHRHITKTAIGAGILLAHPRCDVNVLDRNCRPPIVKAIQNIEDKSDAYASMIKSFLSHSRFDFTIQDIDGWSILHHACCHSVKSPIAAELLLADSRCNINLQSYAKETALMVTAACTNEDNYFMDIMRMILKSKDCDPNIQNEQGQTALHIIVRHGMRISSKERKIKYMKSSLPAKLLISDSRCDVNIRDNTGDTPVLVTMKHLFGERHQIAKDIILVLLDHSECDVMLQGKNGRDALTAFLILAKDLHGYASADDVQEILTRLMAKYNPVKAGVEDFAMIVKNHSFDVCRQLLEKGANVDSMSEANETALHRAVLLNSFRKCQLLLSYNANLTLRWEGLTPCELAMAVGIDPKILELLSEKLDWDTVEKYIKNCSLVGESNSECSHRLGVRPWIQHFGEMASDLVQGLSELKSPSNTKINVTDPFATSLSNSELVQIVRNCDQYFVGDCPERDDVIREIVSLLQKVSQKLSESADTAHLAFEPLLAGSSKEGTKCFYPDEVDMICKLSNLRPPTGWNLQSKSKTKNPTIYTIEIPRCDAQRAKLCNKYNVVEKAKLAVALNEAVVKVLKNMIANEEDLGRIRLYKQPLVWRDKISMLQLLWKGTLFKNMVVHVDIVPSIRVPGNHHKHRKLPLRVICNEYYIIAKASRHFAYQHLESSEEALDRHTRFNVSYSREETTIMRALPSNVKRGYVIAKALRRADICCPGNLGTMPLEENIKSDDYVTSYILKNCLFNLLKNKKREELDSTKDRFDWAEYIYEELERCLMAKKMELHDGKCLFDCSKCVVVRGCCMKVKLMHAMTETMLRWLRENRAALRHDPDSGAASRHDPYNEATLRLDPDEGATLRHDQDNGATLLRDPDNASTCPRDADNGATLLCDPDDGATLNHDPDDGATSRHDTDNGATLGHDPGNGATCRHDPDDGATLRHDPGNGVTIRRDADNGATLRHDPDNRATCRHDPENGVTIRRDADNGATLRDDQYTGATLRRDPDNRAPLLHDPDKGATIRRDADIGATLGFDPGNGAMCRHYPDEGATLRHDPDNVAAFRHDPDNRADLQHNTALDEDPYHGTA